MRWHVPAGRADSLDWHGAGRLARARAVATCRPAHGLSPLVEASVSGAIRGHIGVTVFLGGGGSGGGDNGACALVLERTTGTRSSVANRFARAGGYLVAVIQVLLHPALGSDEYGGVALAVPAVNER